MGDFNGDLGNSLGDKGKRDPNERGLKLLSFANVFNFSPVNLMNMCNGPLETFNSFCGRHHSTLNYIFVLNCLLRPRFPLIARQMPRPRHKNKAIIRLTSHPLH